MARLREASRVTRRGRPPTVPPEAKPKVDHIIIEDDTPVDSMFAEKQQRLLTEPLYSSWRGGKKRRRFIALANVGLFFNPDEPPLVPDVMLSLDVTQPRDMTKKENNTYFVWTRGKVPDSVIEIVSDRRGGEETNKMHQYSTWGIPYYVIFDPRKVLRHGLLRAFVRKGVQYEPCDPAWLEGIELGLTMWPGRYEGAAADWLRWCDQKGQVILTGAERAKEERSRAKNERARAKKASARADAERRRSQKMEEQLRKLGIEPAE
jgi:Uma2 family endonuclease